MKNIIIAAVVLFGTIGCSSQKTTTTNDQRQASRQGQRGERPTTEEMFSKMDANKDGKLSTSEAKGSLQKDFSKIDTDGDGFISKTELENAPKPERGQRPPRNN
jgi:Ca2+-binding EF-hand superfamily protein